MIGMILRRSFCGQFEFTKIFFVSYILKDILVACKHSVTYTVVFLKENQHTNMKHSIVNILHYHTNQ